MPLINCEINHVLTWSSTCAINNSTGAGTFAITNTVLHVRVETLSTHDNAKPLQYLKSSFKRTINWNKYQSKSKPYVTRNLYLAFLIDPNFKGVNRLFVLSFEDSTNRTSHTEYYLRKVEMKGYNFKFDCRNFFDQPINSDIKTYGNIRKISRR